MSRNPTVNTGRWRAGVHRSRRAANLRGHRPHGAIPREPPVERSQVCAPRQYRHALRGQARRRRGGYLGPRRRGGIPADRLPRLFEKFTPLHPGATNQGRGTGLGLTITKALVEQHGATIEVASSRETGSTFTIDLAGDGTSFAQVTASPVADA